MSEGKGVNPEHQAGNMSGVAPSALASAVFESAVNKNCRIETIANSTVVPSIVPSAGFQLVMQSAPSQSSLGATTPGSSQNLPLTVTGSDNNKISVPSAQSNPMVDSGPPPLVVSKPSVTVFINPGTVVASTSKNVPPIRRTTSTNAVTTQANGTPRTTRSRPPLRSASGGSSRVPAAIRTVTAGRRVEQAKTSTRTKKDRSTNSKSSQANQVTVSSTPTAPTPKRRRMTSFQHAFLMCGAKAEPVTPQQSKVTLLQSSYPASNRFRPFSNTSGGASAILGRPGGPSIVRVSSIGAKKIVPPAVRDYLPARRPPYKQTASRMTPAERDRLLTSQPVATPPKRCSNIGTGLRGSLRPGLPGSRLGLSSRVKQESPSTSAESSDKPTEMPDVIARMMQIHAPVSNDGKLPRRDFATISSNGDVEAQEGSAGQSTPTLLPTSYTVSVEKTIEGEEGSDQKGGQVKIRVPPLPPVLKCGVFVVKHQEKTGVKLQPVPSLRGDAVAWLDPRGPFQKQDGSRGTGPYLMYARSEDKDTNRRRFACAHHGCRVTLTADMGTMLVLRRCGTFHRHDNSEADLNKRRIREKLRKRLRLYDGTRTAAEVLREFPELCGQDSEERQKEIKKAAINIRRSPVDGEKISRWGKQLSEVLSTIRTLENLCNSLTTGTSVEESFLKSLESAIGLIPEVQRTLPLDTVKPRKPRKKRKRAGKAFARGRGRGPLAEGDIVHDEAGDEDVKDDFASESPEPLQRSEEQDETRPIIDTGNSVAAVREESHRCGECSQTFWAWANLVRHLRVAHKQPLVDCNSARCGECGVVMRALDSEVENHLDFHGFLGRLRFNSMKDVHIWRTQQECEGGRVLVKIREETKGRNRTTMWVCPRRPDVECRLLECEFCPLATTADPLACSVFIKAIEDFNDGSVDVRYTLKHSSACLQWNLTATCFLHSVRRHVASVAESESRPVILCKDIHQTNEVHPSLLRDDFLVVFCDLHQVRLLSRLTEQHSLSIESLLEGIKLTTVALLLNPQPKDLSGVLQGHSNSGTNNSTHISSQRGSSSPSKLTLVHIISTAADESSLLAAFSELRRYTGRVRARVLVDASKSAHSKCCYSFAREAWRRAMGLGQTQLLDPVSLALVTAEDSASTLTIHDPTTALINTQTSLKSHATSTETALTVADGDPGRPAPTESDGDGAVSKNIDLSEEVDACAAALQLDPLRKDLDRLRDAELPASSLLGKELRGPASADDMQRTMTEACALLADVRASQAVHAHTGSKHLVANGRLALGKIKEAIRLLVEPPVREHDISDGQTLTVLNTSRVEEPRMTPAQVAVGLAVNQAVGQAVGHTMLATTTPVAVTDNPVAVPIANTIALTNPIGVAGSANPVTIASQVAAVASQGTVDNQIAVAGQVTVTGQTTLANCQASMSGGAVTVAAQGVVAPHPTGGVLAHSTLVSGYPTTSGTTGVQMQVSGGQAWTTNHLVPIHYSSSYAHVTHQPVQTQQSRQTYLHH
ncbi:uncharacterized protein LOC111271663 isoform X2 [Varroa jacobsoni]|uniref:uncharacterized protein LOC111271663 isoform X2 n=1 Tax=Varroa jacobsoni TaxID=62625 RepID=UPI000BF9D589|nr:uncharacterized protein LOC111271663 isoform X2 [Varroa jacobsoni]